MSPNGHNGRPVGRLVERTGCIGSVARFWQASTYPVLYGVCISIFPNALPTENLCTGLRSLCFTVNSVHARKLSLWPHSSSFVLYTY
jgi:hypothetical protein